MSKTEFKDLLDAGCHFGHLKRKWNPAMAPYIFDEKKGIHLIDLNKTIVKLDQAAAAMKSLAKSGKKILFVATKKQAKEIVSTKAKEVNMPYVTERWSGGMLTNFATIRKAVKKMAAIDKMHTDGTIKTLSKRERLQLDRTRAKLEKNLGSISDLNRLPHAIFIVDIMKEHIAVAEANKLGISSFGIVDTNSDPREVDFVIPANDDATKSIAMIMNVICNAVKEGLDERASDKEAAKKEDEAKEAAKAAAKAAKAEEAKAAEAAAAEAPAAEAAPATEAPAAEAKGEKKA